jgi:hypothetical protein
MRRTHAAAAAQTGVCHHAVKHQTSVSSPSAYQLGISEVWYLTAWWKARVYNGTCSIPLIWLVFDIRPVPKVFLARGKTLVSAFWPIRRKGDSSSHRNSTD